MKSDLRPAMTPLMTVQRTVASLALDLWNTAVQEYYAHHDPDTANGMLLAMRAVMAAGKPVTASQVARVTGVPYATTRRRLALLLKDGLIKREGHKYIPDQAGVARAYPPAKAKKAARRICDACGELVILVKNI